MFDNLLKFPGRIQGFVTGLKPKPISRRFISVLAKFCAGAAVVLTGLSAFASLPSDPLDLTNAKIQGVIAIQDEVTANWMKQSEVLGTAIGLDPSGSPALIVYIDRDAARAREVILGLPSNIRGSTVQVHLTDKFRAKQDVQSSPAAAGHTGIQTPPIQLGTSGGWSKDLANGFCCNGTLGALVSINGIQHVLSNYHVFEHDIVPGGNNTTAQTGDPIIQPGLIDVNCTVSSAQNVATLVKKSSLPNNNVDCSIAQVSSGMVRTDGSILEIGTISPTTLTAALNQAVKKSGRTTGLTFSSISGLNATISVSYENECAGGTAFTKTFTGQIVIANSGSSFLASGDSGSLLVEDVATNPRSIGLLFAGSSTTAVANPINEVLTFLGATIVGTQPGTSNLTPYQPSGWSDKIVVSNVTGTNTDSPSLTPGDTLYLDWAVLNNGTADITVNFTTELYVDGVLKTSWTNPPPTQANFYRSIQDYNLGSLSAGTHTLRIKADSTNAVAESSEGDNEYTKTITVGSGAQPNLTPYQPSGWSDKIVVSTATGTNTDSTSLTTADTLYLDWAMLNNGTVDINVDFTTELYVDGVLRTSWTSPPPTQANFYRSIQDYSLGSLSAGTHTLRIKADSTNAVAESSESDNEYTKTITVNSINQPNLTPYQPSGWSDKIVVSNAVGTNTDSTSLTTSDTLYVDWAVLNNGTANITSDFTTELYVDGVLKTSWSNPPPTNTNTYRYVLDYNLGSLIAGTHTLRIKADSTNAVAESNESDNEYTKTITVSNANQPNLTPYQPGGWSDKIVVSNVTGTNSDSASITTTDTLYVDWAVANNGTANISTDFTTELYLDGVLKASWSSPPPTNANTYRYVLDYNLGSLGSGSHTLRIKADSTNAVAESSESDNEYTKTINVVAPTTYSIAVSASPSAGGTVSGGGTYNSGSTVTVTAIANSGYTFSNWSENGNVVSSSSSYSFTAAANRTLVANFAVINYTITTSSSPSGSGTTTGDGSFAAGSSRTVTATANSGYTFSNWTESGNVVSTLASYTFTLNGNRTLVANFATISPPTVQTVAPVFVSSTSTIIKGTVTNDGGTPVSAHYFYYWSDPSSPIGIDDSAINTSGNNFSSQLTGLNPNLTYYYRAYANNSSTVDVGAGPGWGYGTVLSFTAKPQVSSVTYSKTNGFTVIWKAKAGLTYQIQRSADPIFASYVTIVSGIAGIEPTTQYVDSSPEAKAATRMFYRVVLQ
jgi:subtilase family serine protease